MKVLHPTRYQIGYFGTDRVPTVFTFRVRRSRGEIYMHIGHGRLCVHLSLAAFPHYCTDPDVSWGNGRECPLVVQYLADLQSVHGFRCYEKNTAEREMSSSACTRAMPGS